MRRREFLALIGGAAVFPLMAHSTTARPLIAFLSGATEAFGSAFLRIFGEGLRDLGYTEGRNMDIVPRFAGGYDARLPSLAEELVSLKPAVIVTLGINGAVAAKKITSTIPIVCAALADAVNLGLVASFAHPGGNVTGITPYIAGLPAKQMELAREVVPGAMNVGLLGNLNDPKAPAQWDELKDAARKLGVRLIARQVHEPVDVDDGIQELARAKVDVVIVLQTTMLASESRNIAIAMAAAHLPAVYGYREHVEAGGLISYGIDYPWCVRHMATFVDKILKGAAPGDIPVEFPSKVKLVINVRAASAIGLMISPMLLTRADEVIE